MVKRKAVVIGATVAALATPLPVEAMPVLDTPLAHEPAAVVTSRLQRIRYRRWLAHKEERRARIKLHRLLERAKSRLGFPYGWGGSGPTYFDCSGFTRWVLAKFGYGLSHSARDQYNEVLHVSKVKEGRLLFFSYGRLGPGVIDHVELALGGGKSIGASNTVEDVDIDPIDWDSLVAIGQPRGWYK